MGAAGSILKPHTQKKDNFFLEDIKILLVSYFEIFDLQKSWLAFISIWIKIFLVYFSSLNEKPEV